ncbi:MAG: FkbM family methyltransferase [Syntrophobacteraceae bacterium]
MDNSNYNDISSLVYNVLVIGCAAKNRIIRNFCSRLWNIACNQFSGPVRTRIHGYTVTVNFGNTYPLFSRIYTGLNNPLLEVTYQVYKDKNSAINFLDIGAATGDTALLLLKNCPDMLNDMFCVEGDPEFFEYLRDNLRFCKNAHLINTVLSSSSQEEKSLVHIHPGTACAIGKSNLRATTMDQLYINKKIPPIDLIKIDVEGLDGKVLFGTQNILSNMNPTVIFEWHPKLCLLTGNNWNDHFKILHDCGYSSFVWFNKYGEFSHFTNGHSTDNIDALANFCVKSTSYTDWHFDIVALHNKSRISTLALADLAFAKARKSYF